VQFGHCPLPPTFWSPFADPCVELKLEPPIAHGLDKVNILIRPFMPAEKATVGNYNDLVRVILWKIQQLYRIDGGDLPNPINARHRMPTSL
jgi:hypothetical protein